MNKILKEYIVKFNNKPPMIITASYEDPIYQVAMIWAIESNTPLNYDNINLFFNNNYDLVSNNKQFKQFSK